MADADDGHRDFTGRRWLINLCRAAHVAGLAGVSAMVLGGVVADAGFYLVLLVASGVGIAAIDGWSNPQHFRQVNGLALLFKMLLVALLVAWEAARLPLFWVILVYSVIVSHAPGSVRHRRLF